MKLEALCTCTSARTVFRTTGFIVFWGIFGQAMAQTDRKFALLIGIGDYPKTSGWQKISAPNDLVVMREVLQKRGFLSENILTLQGEKATRAGILDVWNRVLMPKIQPGDVVYFQFSGHGQQVADDNGDELDGYDEAIVPYDSPLRFEAGVYEGQNLIRDDATNGMITDLRRRLGPKGNLMVVIDACHSGTGTRGMEPTRGTGIPMADSAYIRSAARRPREGLATPQLDNPAPETGALAPMTAFFGSAQNQLNFETCDEQGRGIGSLTYALSRKLGQAPAETTYRGLFDQIRIEMNAIAPMQQPQAEGMLDQELLGGRMLEKPACFRIIRWDDPGTVAVDAGWVQGLNKGAVLGLYPAETRNPAAMEPFAKGTVKTVFPLEAMLELDVDVAQSKASEAWVYVLEQNLGDLKIGLSAQLPQQHPVWAALQQRVEKYPAIAVNRGAAELFLIENNAGLQLIGHGDLLLESPDTALSPAASAERLLRKIIAYGQAKYLRALDLQSEVLNVSFQLIPLRLDPRTKKQVDTLDIRSKCDAAGNLHFQDNDAFTIHVTNKGSKTAYFTLIDLQPDHVVNILIPGAGETPEEFRVAPGQTVQAPKIFQIGPPAGMETFKMIATETPVDLRPIGYAKGANTRANTRHSPLEKLFGATYFNDDCMRRGGETTNLASNSIDVYTLVFFID